MLLVTVAVDPLCSEAAFDELCDVTLREYPEDEWLVPLALWDVGGRRCVVLAPAVKPVDDAFRTWCQELGLAAPRVSSRPATAAEVATWRRQLAGDIGDDADEDDEE